MLMGVIDEQFKSGIEKLGIGDYMKTLVDIDKPEIKVVGKFLPQKGQTDFDFSGKIGRFPKSIQEEKENNERSTRR